MTSPRYRVPSRLVAVLLGLPTGVLLAGLLLPGDPDDPNTKALLLGIALAAVLVPPAATVIGLRLRADHRSAERSRVLDPVALLSTVAMVLLAASWWAFTSTPAPETAAQAAAGPHLWRSSSYLLGGAAALAAGGAVLVSHGGRRRDRTRPGR